MMPCDLLCIHQTVKVFVIADLQYFLSTWICAELGLGLAVFPQTIQRSLVHTHVTHLGLSKLVKYFYLNVARILTLKLLSFCRSSVEEVL